MQYQDKLKERIKELECLYAISALISQDTEMASVIPFICERLAQAFQFPEIASVKISIHDTIYGQPQQLNSDVEIRQNILFQEEIVGVISVSYRSDESKENAFLIEEKKLLNTVSQEIAFLYERQARKKQEAILNEIVLRQERLRILGEMTAGVAHEMNTPLGNVIGFSEFIIENTKEHLVRKDAKKIKQSALHAREIVKKLMLFSCEIPNKFTVSEINPVIQEAIDLLNPLLKQNRVKIEFREEKSKPAALIDKVQFTQVLFNILNNSIQASKPGGKIKINLSAQNGFVDIIIQDFGCGIPPNIQDKIFDPFFTYNKRGSGNGLGLSVVHGIIKKHKGRIQFSSEENVGTTFVISIPQKL